MSVDVTERVDWTVSGPAGHRLNAGDVSALLHIEPAALDRMIAEGRFPRGRNYSTVHPPFWTGLDVACWLHLAGRLGP